MIRRFLHVLVTFIAVLAGASALAPVVVVVCVCVCVCVWGGGGGEGGRIKTGGGAY